MKIYERDWQYLAEGGANVVYRGVGPALRHLVLRIGKARDGRLSSTEQATWLIDRIAPLFDELAHHVVAPSVVEIDPVELLHFARALRDHGDRPARFLDDALDLSDTHAWTLPYMGRDGPSCRTFEFKPKWLTQSPTAPEGATVCRTCALRRMRDRERRAQTRFCPLDLASADLEAVRRAVRALAEEAGWTLTAAELFVLAEHLHGHPLLLRLQSLQLNLETQDMAMAMTLRDCSFYILLDDERGFDLRIGDLDRKASSKAEHWMETESALIKGGFYLGCRSTRGSDPPRPCHELMAPAARLATSDAARQDALDESPSKSI